MAETTLPRVLSIAGSDSGGGAGIQADLKAFAACRVHGMTAITAITAQNTVGVSAIHHVPPAVIEAQVAAVVEDIGVDAVKVGMLGTTATIHAVARALARLDPGIPVVLDPVMVSESGSVLLEPEAREALIGELLGRVTVVTPNLAEARALVGAGPDELCTHSSVLAARLAHGDSPREAATVARRAAAQAVAQGLVEIGAGAGPVDVLGIRSGPFSA
jgi:hydroxymethylpyrimidine/phosphomethylpyrimidine kinase